MPFNHAILIIRSEAYLSKLTCLGPDLQVVPLTPRMEKRAHNAGVAIPNVFTNLFHCIACLIRVRSGTTVVNSVIFFSYLRCLVLADSAMERKERHTDRIRERKEKKEKKQAKPEKTDGLDNLISKYRESLFGSGKSKQNESQQSSLKRWFE